MDVSIISAFTIDSLSNVRGEFEVLVHHHDDERSTEGHPQRLGRDLNWGGGVNWKRIISTRLVDVPHSCIIHEKSSWYRYSFFLLSF